VFESHLAGLQLHIHPGRGGGHGRGPVHSPHENGVRGHSSDLRVHGHHIFAHNSRSPGLDYRSFRVHWRHSEEPEAADRLLCASGGHLFS